MFKCSCCGKCCRSLGNSYLYQEFDRGDGICKYLEGNLCSIYSNRPLLCRIDESYEALFKNFYSKEDYYKFNYEACKNLQGKKEDC